MAGFLALVGLVGFFYLQAPKSAQSSLCEIGSEGNGSGEASLLE